MYTAFLPKELKSVLEEQIHENMSLLRERKFLEMEKKLEADFEDAVDQFDIPQESVYLRASSAQGVEIRLDADDWSTICS